MVGKLAELMERRLVKWMAEPKAAQTEQKRVELMVILMVQRTESLMAKWMEMRMVEQMVERSAA